MTSHHPIRKVVPTEPTVIPDKLYFRIGDVAKLCDVPAYVLRFWETEFPQLKPNKGGTGQRLYRKRDVEMALRIKSLLYDQGYTIPGARQVFSTESKAKEAPRPISRPLHNWSPRRPQLHRPRLHPSQPLPPSTWARPSARKPSAANNSPPSAPNSAPSPTSSPSPPASAPALPAAEATEPAQAKPKSMHPRLVLEPKPDAKATPRLINQGDLFPSE